MSEQFKIKVVDYGIMAAATPGISKNSSPRVQMTWAQAQQAIIPKGAEVSRYLTGLEDQLASNSFMFKASCDMEVVAVINKYPNSQLGKNNFRNPLMTIIYLDHTELLETGNTVYGTMDIEAFQNQSIRTHTTFSYDFNKTDAANRIRVGSTFPKDTVFAAPPTNHDGIYGTGLNLNAAYMGRHATIEDGYLINSDIIDRLTAAATHQYTASWGKKVYPLKLYGKNIFPDIGEKVRKDGLLFAARPYHPLFDGILMTEKNLSRPSSPHDRCIYSHPGGEVRDITAFTSTLDVNASRKTPNGLDVQPSEYAEHQAAYYDRILKTYHELNSDRRKNGGIQFSKELHALIVEAYGYRPNTSSRAITKQAAGRDRNTIMSTYRSTPIDEWHVNITVMYDFKSEIGAKLTGMAGNKGVVCKIAPPEMLGKDEDGNQIDIAVWAKGAIARLNAGQYEEHYVNAHANQVQKEILGLIDNNEYAAARELFARLLKCVSHTMLDEWRNLTHQEQDEELDGLRQHAITIVSPVDDPARHTGGGNIFEALRKEFGRAPKTCVTFVNDDGKVVTTKEPVMIAPMYFWALEKVDHKPFSSYGLRRQHHGLPASVSRANKYRTPVKENGPRVTGEAETRANAASWGGLNTQYIMDMSSNTEATIHLHRAHMTAPDVTTIENAIPRDLVPYGSRATKFITHLLMCRGIKIVQRRRTDFSGDNE